jgi:hypothetical protein
MFDWIKRAFGADAKARRRASQEARSKPYIWSEADAPGFEAALNALTSCGLKPKPHVSQRIRETACDLAKHYSGTTGGAREDASPDKAEYVLFVLYGMSEELDESLFENVILVPEWGKYCDDVIAEYKTALGKLLAVTARRWNVTDITFSPDEENFKLSVLLKTKPASTAFTVIQARVLDVKIFECLNERLPDLIQERFAFVPEPNVVSVFLKPEQISSLNEYCGRKMFFTCEQELMALHTTVGA